VPASYVLDTDVAVAALRSDRGASRQLLLAALNRQFELLLSVPLILEYEAVMTRPQHLAACGLSSAEVGHVLDDLAASRGRFDWRSDGGQGYPILMTTWFWKRL
jgi:predicted nucleic acid-binding protein